MHPIAHGLDMVRLMKLVGYTAVIGVTAATPPIANPVKRQATPASSTAGCPLTTQTSYAWDVKDCTTTYFAPWANPINKWENPPSVAITVAGVDITATVDTGSTGLVASARLFPNANFTRQVEASIFYSSSHWLEEGYEEWIDMTFGPYYIRTKILVKDREVCCPTFNSTNDGHRCPPDKTARNCICSKTCRRRPDSDKVEEKRDGAAGTPPPPVAYMGIGFGRGDPQVMNPFLDTHAFNGQRIYSSNNSFCPGYVITTDGISLGLTKENTAGFRFTSLSQQDVDGTRDWGTPPMRYSVDGGAVNTGTILVDTGISQSYFLSQPVWGNSSVVEVSVPGVRDEYTVTYRVAETNGTWNPMQPTFFERSFTLGYINTGRKFLNCFDIAYDALGGNYGYRYLENSEAMNCTSYVAVGGS